MFIPRIRQGLWDAPTLPVDSGLGAATAAVGASPTDPGCQGHPTILLPAFGWVAADFDHYPGTDCYPWQEEAPAWAGEARGLFRFDARARPARTHGGLASQAAIEARLGRSIPDPTDPDGEVYYWDSYPLVFGVRNNSGETVEARFTRAGGCSDFTVSVADGEELDIGPFWGDPSHVLVQIVGATPGSDSAPTVQPGVEVRVTQPTFDDSGESFDFSCVTPTVAIFDETCEGTGYVETWDQGETVTGGATLDEDAAVPTGAPDWWSSKALHVTVASSGETAYVAHHALGDLTDAWYTFGLYVDDHSLGLGETCQIIELRQSGAEEVLQAYLLNNGGALAVQLQVAEDNSGKLVTIPIAVDTFYLFEFHWDTDADEWELFNSADAGLNDSGTITENPAGYAVDEVELGAGTFGTNEPADYYIGRFTVSKERVGFV